MARRSVLSASTSLRPQSTMSEFSTVPEFHDGMLKECTALRGREQSRPGNRGIPLSKTVVTCQAPGFGLTIRLCELAHSALPKGRSLLLSLGN